MNSSLIISYIESKSMSHIIYVTSYMHSIPVDHVLHAYHIDICHRMHELHTIHRMHVISTYHNYMSYTHMIYCTQVCGILWNHWKRRGGPEKWNPESRLRLGSRSRGHFEATRAAPEKWNPESRLRRGSRSRGHFEAT